MNQDFIQALEEIEREKGIPREIVFDALEKALIKSYGKNYDDKENVTVEIDRQTGEIKVYSVKTVVEELDNTIEEIQLFDARKIKSNIEVGDQISLEITPADFGRIAAQTARNIVIQKIKDAERDIIYNEFIDREKELITGTIQRIDRGSLFIDLGRVEGVIPPSEQIKSEKYNINNRIKLFIKEVKNTTKGAQVILSRADAGLVKRLLEIEVPEINEGVVEIFSITREAGSRTKLAVFTKDENVDPIGACVGYKGSRIKALVDELRGEKLDIIVYDKDIKVFIANSLSPSTVDKVFIDEKEKSARVIVPEDQLSLAIGKEGQNARLAAKLTGWKIDIKGSQQYQEENEKGMIEKFYDGEEDYQENKDEMTNIFSEELSKLEELINNEEDKNED